MQLLQPERLFPPGVELALHGHMHLFEAIGFASPRPATRVMRSVALPQAAKAVAND